MKKVFACLLLVSLLLTLVGCASSQGNKQPSTNMIANNATPTTVPISASTAKPTTTPTTENTTAPTTQSTTVPTTQPTSDPTTQITTTVPTTAPTTKPTTKPTTVTTKPTVQPNPASDFEYVISEKGGYVTIDGYVGTAKNVVVPNHIEGLPVRGVSLKGNKTIESIVLPDTYETIYMEAFMSCSNLRSVVLGKNVALINPSAFSHCTKLESISFPASLETIGDGAFMCCTGLKSVSFANGLKEIDTGAFSYCENLEKAILPIGLETIGNEAFAYCTGLKEVFIPKTVRFKGTNNFLGAEALTSLTFEDGTTRIGSYAAFMGASSLKQVTIPASVTEICDMTFSACPKLETVIFLGSAPEKVGGKVFGTPNKDIQIIYNPSTSGWDDTPLSEFNLVPM